MVEIVKKLLVRQLSKRKAIIEVFFHKAKVTHTAKLSDVADDTIYLYFNKGEIYDYSIK